MSAGHPESVKSEIKRYWKVFAALTLGTIITVAVAGVHLGIVIGIAVAALVAIIKGSLVAAYFMHLLHERKLIYLVLVLTAGGVVIMAALILFSRSDQQGIGHGVFDVPQRFVDPATAHGGAHGAVAPASPHPDHGAAPHAPASTADHAESAEASAAVAAPQTAPAAVTTTSETDHKNTADH